MILENSVDSSKAVSGTIRTKIRCSSMVSICIGKKSRDFSILKAEKV